uniref:Uncharacterized protein n=1 Tax=Amphimedon queenslandica TaxID=400682 RepID=A0A1X7VUL9_AMPQE
MEDDLEPVVMENDLELERLNDLDRERPPGGRNPGGRNPGGRNPGGRNPGGRNPGGRNPGGRNGGPGRPSKYVINKYSCSIVCGRIKGATSAITSNNEHGRKM